MSIYDYILLDIGSKACLLRDQGEFIFSHHERENNTAFYKLEDFYVEVTMDNSRQEIVRITPFRRLMR